MNNNNSVDSWLDDLHGIYINTLRVFFSYEGELYLDEVRDELSIIIPSTYTRDFNSVVESNGGEVGYSVHEENGVHICHRQSLLFNYDISVYYKNSRKVRNVVVDMDSELICESETSNLNGLTGITYLEGDRAFKGGSIFIESVLGSLLGDHVLDVDWLSICRNRDGIRNGYIVEFGMLGKQYVITHEIKGAEILYSKWQSMDNEIRTVAGKMNVNGGSLSMSSFSWYMSCKYNVESYLGKLGLR
jgi:hypothetical protein